MSDRSSTLPTSLPTSSSSVVKNQASAQQVYLSLGSNIEPVWHITAALDALAEIFGRLEISSVYESEAVGFVGDNFYNLVVGVNTSLSVGDLSRRLKAIEDANGRERSGPKFSGRTLDIDILTVAQLTGVVAEVVLPREEIVKNAFVLWPLAEIAGAEIHPQLQMSYTQLWQAYDKLLQKLWPVEFYWRSQKISPR